MRGIWLCLILPVLISVLFLQIIGRDVSSLTLTREGSSIRIERNEYSIPSIYADSLENTFFGLGYAQGQDRL